MLARITDPNTHAAALFHKGAALHEYKLTETVSSQYYRCQELEIFPRQVLLL